ncbi:TIGR03620 family F420-dependent LLM class oxidoreductase [Phytohabitans sp. ZYX-F-186]|uniref:TIGR03620 family F420-dependent LLM class oxidoreductase n=1 Tax=Phytohabitans maris TaxID=3071409 RepID=A0ABU0Z9J0_9ACTN|nr:TIGR03620 family F420-dependent LLM class oxidoreductase [Phytohabitans sp. ZYX-F-186]MDQ7903709.1 TIGR03620 family F420-dependent LLM class oxidoreductase [Phytohabitans sp. ZYX-F-186]
MTLRGVGLWSRAFRQLDAARLAEVGAELEELGYAALWLPGEMGGDVFGPAERLLAATGRVTVAVGVLNIWMHDPAEVAAAHDVVAAKYPGRFLLGLGVSHGPAVDRYAAPLRAMREFLDRIEAEARVTWPADRLLGALGARMLELARERTAGAHPYLVTPEHTARARALLGPDALLAPEQKVLLETDPGRARSLARGRLAYLFDLPNYANNLRRLGFGEGDLAGGGSDRLVDALVAWGDPERVVARVAEHIAAGADHVTLHALSADPTAPALDQWRRIAEALPAARPGSTAAAEPVTAKEGTR